MHRAETVPLEPDGLVHNVDRALVEDVFNLSQTDQETDVVHPRDLMISGLVLKDSKGEGLLSLPDCADQLEFVRFL